MSPRRTQRDSCSINVIPRSSRLWCKSLTTTPATSRLSRWGIAVLLLISRLYQPYRVAAGVCVRPFRSDVLQKVRDNALVFMPERSFEFVEAFEEIDMDRPPVSKDHRQILLLAVRVLPVEPHIDGDCVFAGQLKVGVYIHLPDAPNPRPPPAQRPRKNRSVSNTFGPLSAM